MIDLQIWFKKKSVSRSDSYHKLFDSQKIKSKFCFTNAYVKIFFFVVCYLYLLFSVPSLASLYYLSSLSISFSLSLSFLSIPLSLPLSPIQMKSRIQYIWINIQKLWNWCFSCYIIFSIPFLTFPIPFFYFCSAPFGVCE